MRISFSNMQSSFLPSLTLQKLLERLSCVAAQDAALSRWGWTPLHRASLHDHVDMVKLLLSHGAGKDAADSEVGHPLIELTRSIRQSLCLVQLV